MSRGLVPVIAGALTDARATQALEVAVAATLAWTLIAPFGGVADEYPYCAPLGAVVSVAGTVASSLGTLMRLRNRGAPSGFAKVAAPMVARAMKSAMSKDLARLAERLAPQ